LALAGSQLSSLRMRNVLLMLSSAQPPHPDTEIASLAERSRDGSPVALVTTRKLRELTPGASVVAFYGDVALGNRYLGCGIFERLVDINAPVGQAVRHQDELYGTHGIPAGAKGLIILSRVRKAAHGERLEGLAGIIEASGLPLTLDNLPKSAARIQVYYTTSDPCVGCPPAPAS
jgi:hypothetical protein